MMLKLATKVLLLSVFLTAFTFPMSFTQGGIERWVIATLEWPPFVCSKCPNNGAAAEVLRNVLRSQGISVEYVFYPWVQARKNASKPSYVGYFPAWKEELVESFEISAPLFSSPLVFLQNKKKPLVWKTLKDLKGKKFAVTSGYGNTGEFNKLVEDKVILVEEYLSDEATLKRLNDGDVDGVLMDYMVAQYYLSKVFPQFKKNIDINPRILERKDLYLVFNSHSKNQRQRFKKILEKYNFSKQVDEILVHDKFRP